MTRFVRHLAIAAPLLIFAVGGCASGNSGRGSSSAWLYPHASASTLSQSPHEHRQAISNSITRDRQALIEDLDILFMTERPTRLTRWHDR